MNASPPGATRVVVAFDPYFPDRAALLLALRLASPGSQSLHALYVEETDALTLGSFPWAREITAATAESRPMQMKAIERAYISRASEARALLETTAAAVAEVTFEQVREVITGLRDAASIGVCYDTCQGFAAGYDIRTKKGVDAVAKKIDETVGLDRLKGMHLNDCLREFDSHVDRHWHIGEGKIGLDGFKYLLNHPAFRVIPKIM